MTVEKLLKILGRHRPSKKIFIKVGDKYYEFGKMFNATDDEGYVALAIKAGKEIPRNERSLPTVYDDGKDNA